MLMLLSPDTIRSKAMCEPLLILPKLRTPAKDKCHKSTSALMSATPYTLSPPRGKVGTTGARSNVVEEVEGPRANDSSR